MESKAKISIYNQGNKVYSSIFLLKEINFENNDWGSYYELAKRFPNSNVNIEWENGDLVLGMIYNQEIDEKNNLDFEEYQNKWYNNPPIEENLEQKIRQLESDYVTIIEI